MNTLFPGAPISHVRSSSSPSISIKSGIEMEKNGITHAKKIIKEKREELEKILMMDENYSAAAEDYKFSRKQRLELKKKILATDESARQLVVNIKIIRENLKNHQITLAEYLETHVKITQTSIFEGQEIVINYKLK